ncbi:MAG: phytoene desaturase [Marinovum sp.]|nr:phytoene desaturase [Marinovum sp.]
MTRLDPHLPQQVQKATAPHAVVVGAGLGGLAASMRLGAMGYRVTIIDRLDVPGGRGSCIHKGGHRFDLGPTIVTVPQLYEDLWATCGRNFHDDIDLRRMDPMYEIRWPDGTRLSAQQSTDAMIKEIERIAPDDVPGYKRYLQDAENRYWFGFEDLGRRPMHKLWELIKVLPKFVWYRADRSIARHAQRRVKDPRVQFALSFHPLFIGGDPFKVTSMYALVSHLEKEFGVWYAIGGVAAMARAMAKIIQEQGGTLRMETEVDEILLEGNCACGVRLVSGEEIDADIVVANSDVGHTYERLLRNYPKKRWTDRKLESRRWSMSLFVWYFGTKGTAGRWADVGHHTIASGPRYEGLVKDIFRDGKVTDDMSLYIHRPSVTDPTVAPKGGDTFYVLSCVPHLGHNTGVHWGHERDRYKAKMLEILERDLMPGLGETISEEEVFTPESFKSRYLSPFGAGFSLEPRIFQSAWFRPHNVSEEAENLFLVGAGTHPGAGVPGVVATAEVLCKVVPQPSEIRA